MLKRTITGVVLIATLVVVFLLLPAWCTAVLLAAMVFLAVKELLQTTKLVDNDRLVAYAQVLAVVIVVLSCFGTDYYRALIVALLFSVLFFSEMLRSHGKLPFQQVAMSIVAGTLIPFLLSALVRIRVMENGVFFIAAPFVMAFMTDTGAYLIGCSIGKHKLMPKVSPKKSVEGAVGGIFVAVVGAMLLNTFVEILPVGYMAFIAVVISIGGQLGDLCESAVKRWAGVKDSGNLIPGHGGMLDRFDSMLFAAPLLLFFISIYTQIIG